MGVGEERQSESVCKWVRRRERVGLVKGCSEYLQDA